jgi:GAF domain-containing protein
MALPQLEALNRLITAVSGSLDLDEILREAVRTAVDTLGAAAYGVHVGPFRRDFGLRAGRRLNHFALLILSKLPLSYQAVN